MNKYIIEIEDVPFSKVRIDADGAQNINLYRAKGFNALVFDKHGLDKLTPLDKALNNELEEAYHKGFEVGSHEATTLEYQQGLNDAWECAKKISLMSPDEIEKVFPGAAKYNRYNLGYSGVEAIEKLKAYEEQKKADAEIKVGDEVMSNNAISDHTGVVLALSPGENSAKVLENDGSMAWVAVNVLIKTGRHFNFLTSLLNAMKEGAE